MSRKPLQRSESLPYHVTARANNREIFPLALPKLWEIMRSEGLIISILYGAEIHALVLMPNHFHMLLTVPEQDLGIVMNSFICSITRLSNLHSGRSGHLFGGPYYRALIQSTRYFGHALKYVYRNPVRAKLCERVENYPYSSLHGLLGFSHLPFPIYFTRKGLELGLPFIQPDQQLSWLNTPFSSEAEALIRKGLRRQIFETVVDRKTRMPSKLLTGFL